MNYGERDHYLSMVEHWEREAAFYKRKLFDAWASLRQQQKGLSRQARKIRRLSAELEEANKRIEQIL